MTPDLHAVEFASGSEIVGALVGAARRRPTGWAVRDPHTSVSYPDLLARVEAEAAGLAAEGLKPGTLVLIEAVHRLDYLVSYFACPHVGAHLMPSDPAASAPEVDREIDRYGVESILSPGPSPRSTSDEANCRSQSSSRGPGPNST